MRRANGDFFVTRGARASKEIGDIRAGDQKDETDRAEEHEQRWAHRAHESILQDKQLRVPAFVGLGIFLRELAR